MGKRKERPDGIVLYAQSLKTLQLLPDEAAGKAIKAAVAYFTAGAEMEADQTMEYLAFSILKLDVDAACDRFREKCEQNRRNRNSGDQPSPVVTNGDQNRNELKKTELNQIKSEPKGSEPKKGAAQPPAPAPARDENSLIFLSDEDYEALKKELGDVELARVINYLSTYCRSSGKRYNDWPFVIRRASAEKWGVKPSGGSTTPGDFQPSSDRIQQHNAWIDGFLEEQKKQQGSKSRWDLEAIVL